MKFFYLCSIITFTTCLAQNTREDQAHTVRELNDINPDGSYNYAYETSNQIFAEEQGSLKDPDTLVVQGQYQYTSPEGEIVRLVYTADEDGFHPQGAHLPTAPPIPEAILRALDYIARNPSKESQ